MNNVAVGAGLLFASLNVLAASGVSTGEIHYLRGTGGGVAQQWVVIDVAPASGVSCGADNGRIRLYLKDDDRANRQMSVIASALARGQSITVGYDDQLMKNATYCYLQFVDAE